MIKFLSVSQFGDEYYTNSMAFIRGSASGATVKEGLYAAATNTNAIDTYLAENGFTE